MTARGTNGERLGFLTRKHGIKVDSPSSVEEVSLAVGAVIGHDNVLSASRMNSAVVLFLASVDFVEGMVEAGVVVEDVFFPVLPLASPSKKVILSNVPPFISNEFLTEALARYGKVVSPPKMIPLATKSPLLKHVVSFRRFAYIVLKDNKDLELSLNVKVDDFNYTIYASTNTMKCFSCGQLGHLARNCSAKAKDDNVTPNVAGDGKETSSAEKVEAPAGGEGEGGVGKGAGIGDGNGEGAHPTETPEDGSMDISEPEMPDASQGSSTDLAEQILNEVIEEQSPSLDTENVFKAPQKKRGGNNSKGPPKKKAQTADAVAADADNESDYASDCSITCSLRASGFPQQSYTVNDIKAFLSKTKRSRNVKIDNYFADVEQFIEKTTLFLSEGGFTDQEGHRLKKILGKLKDFSNSQS